MKRTAISTELDRLPAGKYWVGDLCYVLDENIGFDWGEFCNWMYDNDPYGRIHEGTNLYDDKHIAFHGTAYGDGCYSDQHGHSFGVDAGMIGCVLAEDVGLGDMEEGECNGGHIIVFDKPFTTSYNNGTIKIGGLVIETKDVESDIGYYDDEDDDYDDDCYDEDGRLIY